MKEHIIKYSQSPIFIGGLFKSGTTLLRAMLGQHSAIASGLETYWFDIDWDEVRNKKTHANIERLRTFYGLDKDLMDEIVAESKDMVQFLNMLLGHYAESLGKRRWAEKTPGNILHLERIYDGWSDAKVIHIIRDPRDVFASLKQAKKWDTIEKFVELWCLFLGTAETSKRELNLDGNIYLEIRYEDLVIRPEKTMRNVINFLNEVWEEGLASFEGKKDEYDKVLEVTGKASTTLDRLRRPLSNKRVGIWRETLRQDEVEKIHHLVEQEGRLSLMTRIERETPQ